jgi:hypothetical protein
VQAGKTWSAWIDFWEVVNASQWWGMVLSHYLAHRSNAMNSSRRIGNFHHLAFT